MGTEEQEHNKPMPWPQYFPSLLLFLFRGSPEPGGVHLSSNPQYNSLKYLSIFLFNPCQLFEFLTTLNIHWGRGHYWALNTFSWNYLWCWDLISEWWGSAQCPSLSTYRYNYFAQGLAVYIYLCRISFAILLSSDSSHKVLVQFFTVCSHCYSPRSWIIC